MKKSLVLLLMCMMMLCSCSEKNDGTEKLPAFEGKWQCAETPLEHPERYTGYLMWAINKDGSFSMYDAEAGNPGITGDIQIISDQELRLYCNIEDDFDPPVTWESMEKTQVVVYEFITDKELRVTLVSEECSSTLVFTKVG